MSGHTGVKPRHPNGPTVIVVMAVSGSGKSTVASLLAERLGWPFVDGDDLHSPDHVAKMHAGLALDEHDREPWLAKVGAWIDARLDAGENGVIVCSALRRSYRDHLRRGRSAVRIVYLEGERGLIRSRLEARRGHFMPAKLLDSQFAALDVPERDEDPITVGIADSPDDIAATITARLGFREGAPA